MIRLVKLAAVAVLGLVIAGCDKPSPENCKKALQNMARLLGNESQSDEAALATEVRRCTGGSSRKSVECATKASSLDELRACEFYKVPAAPTPAPGSGSGSAPAPGSGSAPAPAPAPAPAAGSGSAQ
jgi:hypothetical protein